MTAPELRSENTALAARSLVERVTGIEPTISLGICTVRAG